MVALEFLYIKKFGFYDHNWYTIKWVMKKIDLLQFWEQLPKARHSGSGSLQNCILVKFVFRPNQLVAVASQDHRRPLCKTLPVEPSPLPLKYNKLYKPADKTNNSARKIQTIKIYTISFPKENMLGKKKC